MSAAEDYRAAVAHFNTSAVILYITAQHKDLPDSIEEAKQNHKLSERRLDDAVRALMVATAQFTMDSAELDTHRDIIYWDITPEAIAAELLPKREI